MSSGSVHQLIAAAAVGTFCHRAEKDPQQKAGKSLIGAVIAAGSTKLPDVLEPALHPNHRQFFHSVAFAAMLGAAAYKVYRWQPEEPVQKAARFVLLVSASAYLIHLLLDAGTPKSLPLLGRL